MGLSLLSPIIALIAVFSVTGWLLGPFLEGPTYTSPDSAYRVISFRSLPNAIAPVMPGNSWWGNGFIALSDKNGKTLGWAPSFSTDCDIRWDSESVLIGGCVKEWIFWPLP